MRKLSLLSLICSCLALAPAVRADAFLVRDLATSPTTGPGTPELDALELGGILYFRADHPRSGNELWRSDGTADGTRLFADLCRGPCSSGPRPLGVLGDELYFVADDGIFGNELWATDGTRDGTRLVRDVCAGPCGSAGNGPATAAVLGDRLVLAADDGDSGLEPWVTDGTRDGTVRIADLCQGRCGSRPQDLFAAGPRVFFRTDDALWATDGTAEGTRRVAGPCFDCRPRAAVGERLVFSRRFPPRGTELWVSDGTRDGTELLIDACPGPCDGSRNRFEEVAVVDGTVYFTALGQPFENLRNLYRSDGTPAGTAALLGDPEYHAVSHLTPVAGGLAFATFNDRFDRVTVWWTDGTAGGTGEIVGDLRVFFAIFQLAAGDDRLFYVTYSPNFRARNLWGHDGDRAELLGIFIPPPGSSLLDPALAALTPFGDGILFKAFEEDVGWELWSSADAATNSVRLADLDADAGSSRPRRLAGLGDRLLFVADTDDGTAVLRSDGTASGTLPLAAGPPSTLEFGHLGDTLMFSDDRFAFGDNGLWSTDGTSVGTRLLADDVFSAHAFVESGGRVFFSADGTGGDELRVSDGSPAGTALVADLTPGLEPSVILPCCFRSTLPHDLVAVDGGVLFGAATGESTGLDDELWRSDGSAAGTVLVRDVCEGVCSSTPRELTRLGDVVFFSAEDPQAGRELWRSDGSADGTRRVLDLRRGPQGSDPHHLFVLGDRLYFFARGPQFWVEDLWGPLDRARAAGDSLWSTDGTAAGTERVHDLRLSGMRKAGLRSWVTDQRTVAGRAATGRSFFVVANELTGPELWVSDGTRTGTHLLRDLRRGAAGSYPSSLTAVGDLLVFTADDGIAGAEGWVSDGTAAGTRLVADLEPGEGSSRPAEFTAAGELILFSAETPASGRELWAVERVELAGDRD